MILVPAARPADANEITIPLPELLGSYACNDPSPLGLWTPDSVHVQTNIPWSQVRSVSLVFAGSTEDGLVVGDGVLRPAEQATLPGRISFGAGYQLGWMTFFNLTPNPECASGTFSGQWPVWIPDENTECGLVYPDSTGAIFQDECEFPQFYEVILGAILAPDLTRADLPDLHAPPELSEIPLTLNAWTAGLEVVEPITAEISEAYLVIETVPEPTTVALLLGAGAVWLRRRRR